MAAETDDRVGEDGGSYLHPPMPRAAEAPADVEISLRDECQLGLDRRKGGVRRGVDGRPHEAAQARVLIRGQIVAGVWLNDVEDDAEQDIGDTLLGPNGQ